MAEGSRPEVDSAWAGERFVSLLSTYLGRLTTEERPCREKVQLFMSPFVPIAEGFCEW
jgi:hypothetical protein